LAESRADIPVKSIHLARNTNDKIAFPGGEGGHYAPEDFAISLFPYFPGWYRENFHEEGSWELLLGFLNGVKEKEAMIPGNIQVIPTFRAEGTLKDKMVGELFNVQVIENTVVVVTLYLEMLPFQQVPWVDPISE
jgi:hypothetical protein